MTTSDDLKKLTQLMIDKMAQDIFSTKSSLGFSEILKNVSVAPKIWARAVRSVDPRTDTYVEPTIGQMIHFQVAAREIKDADPAFENGGLTGFGRDAFEWFFGRPTNSDFTVSEVKKAWARHDIHNARNRRRILGDDWAHKHDNAYAFLRLCAAHGLMIRIEETEKGRVQAGADKNPIWNSIFKDSGT